MDTSFPVNVQGNIVISLFNSLNITAVSPTQCWKPIEISHYSYGKSMLKDFPGITRVVCIESREPHSTSPLSIPWPIFCIDQQHFPLKLVSRWKTAVQAA